MSVEYVNNEEIKMMVKRNSKANLFSYNFNAVLKEAKEYTLEVVFWNFSNFFCIVRLVIMEVSSASLGTGCPAAAALSICSLMSCLTLPEPGGRPRGR